MRTGSSGLEFDADALRNGTLAVTHARGLFADGLAFDLPASDPAPPSRPFAPLFSPVADHLTMHLAVPVAVRDGQNTSLNGTANGTRFIAFEQKMPDQNTGLDEKPIQVGRKNLQLLAESETSDRYVHLPIVRLLRDGTGRFEADPAFVPPCLTISASPALTNMLRRLLDILDEKSTVFTQEQQQRNGVFQAGMSARHVAQYWFLHALNSNLPALRHFLLCQHAHPQELFREMLRLGGAPVHVRHLEGASARSALAYDHGNLDTCFAALDEHIRRHLEIVMPSKAIKIPLSPVESFLYNGDVKDERCLGPSRWILEIQSPIGEADLDRPCAQADQSLLGAVRGGIDQKRALPGLVLKHLSVPPVQIAARTSKVNTSRFNATAPAGNTSCRRARWESTCPPRSRRRRSASSSFWMSRA